MASTIRIKRSATSGNPSTLAAGELAYSGLTDNGTNGGDRLYIGFGAETSGNAANHFVVGGKYFTDKLDHDLGTLTPNSAILVDSDSKIDNIKIDNLDLDGNTISSTDFNGSINIDPIGTGEIYLTSDNIILGNIDDNVNVTTQGTGDLLISTNEGTNSGTISLPAGTDQNITVTPNGLGNVILSTDTTVIGDSDLEANLTTQGTGSLVIDTNEGTNTGNITLEHGVDGDITIEPLGTGRTIAHNLFVDDGSTNRSIQEFVEDISGGQIVGTAGVVSVVYSDNAGETTIDLIETGVATGSYGSQTKIPSFTVDADGRLTAAGEVDVATTLSLTGDDTTNTAIDLLNDTLAFTGVNAMTVTADNSTVTVTADSATTTSRGVASFDSSNFDVFSGAVSTKDITLGTSTLTLGSTTSTIDGLNQLDVDNIRINGNTIFSTDIDGDIILSPDSSTQTVPGSVNVDDSRIINVNNPIDPKDAANKRYVDDVAQGLQALPAADLATTANLNATYDNGDSGVGATLTSDTNGAFPVIDGIQLELNENILVKDQTNLFENGSYVLTQVGDASNPWVLTRCFFCDEEDEIRGAFEFVTQGTQFGNTGFVATVPVDFVIGSTDSTTDTNGFTNRGDIVWVQFSGSGTFTAGTNLNLDGTEFNLNDNISIVDLASSGIATFTSLDELVLDTGNNIVSAPFTVSGGAAFEKDTVTEGIATFTNTADAIDLDSGAVIVDGGAAVKKTIYVGDDLVGSGVATSEIDRFTIDGGTY